MNEGDWICSDLNCGNINFARRNSCYRCNKERPNGDKVPKKKLGTEIGKSAAEKSRGLFNADDWQCNKCANVNWARRQTCNVCNAPKFGEVEARTGYGGGYNERGVVEYRRREPSSEDEYDEFGRKKRKRQSESEDKVGITEGPENKKVPPTVLQKESKMDLDMSVPPPNIPLQIKREKVTGSLSDGSVCDLAPLSKMALKQNQFQNHHSYYGVDFSIPPYNTNGNSVPSRKRFSSVGDKDYIGPLGYETSSKSSRNDSNVSPGLKSYNPVMENRVSSTNNDVIYKFTGSTPAEDFEVTYTVEERVRAAAFAIVYNNCKISTDKFEALYDKPAPDFKTIFGWRQRLITTGCLVDAHLEIPKKDSEVLKKDVEVPVTTGTNPTPKAPTRKEPIKLPNPDEIAILSECGGDSPKKSEVNKHSHFGLRQKSLSTDTLLIGGIDVDTRVAVGSSIDERISQGRSHSASTHRSHSQDSSYSDSDLEQEDSKSNNKRKSSPAISNTRQSVNNSDSESYSYNSDDVDFRSRVFGDRKIKRKIKKRIVSCNNSPRYISGSNENQSFQGYSTRKSMEQSPLVTGNIYTINHRNMGVQPKLQDNQLLDTDGCSSEYVPTRLAATAKKNYQDFKNNVKKRGFWAKGNGNSFSRNLSATSSSTIESTDAFVKGAYVKDYYSEPQVVVHQANMAKGVVSSIVDVQGYVSTSIPCLESQSQDFTKDEIDNTVTVDQYLPFDKPVGNTHNSIIKTFESNSTIFDLVLQSSSVKNRSVMEIFGNNEQSQDSSEGQKQSENINGVRKQYESEWNDEDDILYKNSDSVEMTLNFHGKSPSSPPCVGSLKTLSPSHNTKDDVQNVSVKYVTQNIIDNKHEMLLGMLQDVKDNKDEYINDCVSHNLVNTTLQSDSVNGVNQQNQLHLVNPNIQKIQPFAVEIPSERKCISEEVLENTPTVTRTKTTINPSKKVRILESITIKANNEKTVNYSQNNLPPHSTDGIISANENNVLHQNISAPHYTNRCYPANEEIKKHNHVSQAFTLPEKNSETQQNVPQIDLTNLLSGINTNTLLIALQNLQQLTNKSNNISQTNVDLVNSQNCEQNDVQKEKIETINLTNDEEWEKESNQDESIERELEKLDGNPEDMQCFSDIFDPGPVVPANVKKLNINLKNTDEKTNQTPHLNENAPVIGSFKSFALPKPILLNRLKLTVKQPEKGCKDNGKKGKRKRKPKASASEGGQGVGEEDEEESGDEADLSKYDLWGSDGEQGNSSKMDNDNEDDRVNEDELNAVDKNGKPDVKNRKRSHSSSSSSSSSSNSSSSHSSSHVPKNKFDDFNLNSERESQHGSPKGRKAQSRSRSRSRSRSPRSRSTSTPLRRKSRDSRSGGESRNHETSRDKERSRDRDRRDRSRGARDTKERRYSRDGNHYSARGRHR